MANKVILTEPYYKEFHKRKGMYFNNLEAVCIYRATQDMKTNWPRCLGDTQVPPDVVKNGQLYYVRFNFAPPQQIKFRICFGVQTVGSDVEIVALTCRTKQELSGGSQTGTQAWKKHMNSVGKSRWNDYRRKKLRYWQIY